MGPAKISTLVGWHLSKTQRRLRNGQGRAQPGRVSCPRTTGLGNFPAKSGSSLFRRDPPLSRLWYENGASPQSALVVVQLIGTNGALD